MYAMPEVPFPELINRPKATMAKLAQARPHGLRLRRRDDVDLVLREVPADDPRTRTVDIAVKLLAELMQHADVRRLVVADVAPQVFPWIRFLPREAGEEFLQQLADLLRATEELDDPAPVLHLVTEWQHTAEVYADPELLAILMRGDDEHGDFGPVPPPPGAGTRVRSVEIGPPLT
ncbi:hypothetical protein [Marinactinospora rubrisoli]|uniref:Prevent-host-death family protein n=1 Tax=Marinactinospora rubrisoli TaxID=2715399 RepID=A0ABW2KPD8_9ACTN